MSGRNVEDGLPKTHTPACCGMHGSILLPHAPNDSQPASSEPADSFKREGGLQELREGSQSRRYSLPFLRISGPALIQQQWTKHVTPILPRLRRQLA